MLYFYDFTIFALPSELPVWPRPCFEADDISARLLFYFIMTMPILDGCILTIEAKFSVAQNLILLNKFEV